MLIRFNSGAPPTNPLAAWHGQRTFDYMKAEGDDVPNLTDTWDGCTYNSKIEVRFYYLNPGIVHNK